MQNLNFKKVNYLGEGYMHIVKNLATNKQEYFNCSKELYELMSGVGGEVHNPTFDGYEWISSCKGTILTDSPNSCLNPFEFCEKDGEIMLAIRNKDGQVFQTAIDKSDFLGLNS